MARETVMSTPIFDQLLSEMAQRADPHLAATSQPSTPSPAEQEELHAQGRRRHRAE